MRASGVVVALALLATTACDGGSDSESADTTVAVTTEATQPEPATTAPATTEPATTAPATTVPETTEPATTAPEITEPTTEAPAPESEAELSASALLTLDDMPDGWTETLDDPSDDDETKAILAECTGLDPTLISDDVLGDTKAKSGEFASPDGAATVQHAIGLAPDEATAMAAITALGDDSMPDCYVDAITGRLNEAISGTDPENSMPPGVTLTGVTFEPVSLIGVVDEDEGVWYSAMIALEYQGQAIESFVDLIWLRDGRALTQLELGGDGTPFPGDLLDPIVTQTQENLADLAAG